MSLRFSIELQMEVPRERVFTALQDIDSWGGWMPGLVGVQRLTRASFGPGTVWRETRRFFGKEATEEFEVVEVEAPRRIVLRADGMKGSSGRGEYLYTYTLEEVDGGTRVSLDGEVSGLGPLFTVIGRGMMGAFRKSCTRDLEALRAHLAGGAPSGATAEAV